MAEEKNRSFGDESTSDLSFEDYIKTQFELVFNRFDQLENRAGGLEMGLAGISAEMVERFLQLSRQIRDVDAKVSKVDERGDDLDYKLDGFINEQLRMKREWREFQEKQSRSSIEIVKTGAGPIS